MRDVKRVRVNLICSSGMKEHHSECCSVVSCYWLLVSFVDKRYR